jgi:hypothetical protein
MRDAFVLHCISHQRLRFVDIPISSKEDKLKATVPLGKKINTTILILNNIYVNQHSCAGLRNIVYCLIL